jgi:hypothetical protein
LIEFFSEKIDAAQLIEQHEFEYVMSERNVPMVMLRVGKNNPNLVICVSAENCTGAMDEDVSFDFSEIFNRKK